MLRLGVLVLLAATLVAPPAFAVGAHAGPVGSFAAVGKLAWYENGFFEGACLEAYTLTAQPDGSWRVAGAEPGSSDDFGCHGVDVGIALWLGGNDLRGAPETGFVGGGTVLGVTDSYEIGPLGAATSFHQRETSTGAPGQTFELVGTLDFAPTA